MKSLYKIELIYSHWLIILLYTSLSSCGKILTEHYDVTGILYEQTLDYDITFQIGGITMLISGLLFCSLHLPCFASYRKDLQTVDDMEMPNLEFTDDFIENSEHKSDYN